MYKELPIGIMDTASATSNGHQRRPYDRFIPFRPNLNVEESHAKLFSPSPSQKESVPGQYRQSGAKGYWRLLSDAFHERDLRILPMTPTKSTPGSPFSWNSPCLSPDEGYDSPLRGSKRKVATSPDCIMDMPGLLDDFCNNNLLASLYSTPLPPPRPSIPPNFFQLYLLFPSHCHVPPIRHQDPPSPNRPP